MSSQLDNTPPRDAAGGRSVTRDRLREAILAHYRSSSDEETLVANTIIMRSGAFNATRAALLKAVRDFTRELRQAQVGPERAVIEAAAVVAEVDVGRDGVHRRLLDAVVRQAVEAYYEP
jgi:hypothetical protein